MTVALLARARAGWRRSSSRWRPPRRRRGGGRRTARGPVTNLPLPRFVSMRADSANARRGPSLDQRVDWEFVRRGLPLEVTAEYGQWRRVRDADGAGGWVHHTLLSGVRTALVRGDGAGAAARRADRGVGGAGDGRARAWSAGSRPAASAWCEIAAGGVEGWLPRGAIWGVGPDETIE